MLETYRCDSYYDYYYTGVTFAHRRFGAAPGLQPLGLDARGSVGPNETMGHAGVYCKYDEWQGVL